MPVLDEDGGWSGKGAGVGGARGMPIGQFCLEPLTCNPVGKKSLSNDIKANEYRTRPYTTYTTLGTGAQTMFVRVSQE